jgi:transposase
MMRMISVVPSLMTCYAEPKVMRPLRGAKVGSEAGTGLIHSLPRQFVRSGIQRGIHNGVETAFRSVVLRHRVAGWVRSKVRRCISEKWFLRGMINRSETENRNARIFKEIRACVWQWGVLNRLKRSEISRQKGEIIIACLWVCATRSRWEDLPVGGVTSKTAHRHFVRWRQNGVWDKVLWLIAGSYQVPEEERTAVKKDPPLLRYFSKQRLAMDVTLERLLVLARGNELPGALEGSTWVLELMMNPYGPRERKKKAVRPAA